MEPTYACTKCNPPLQSVEGTRRELEKHMAEHHFNFRPQRCRGCGFRCYDEQEMVTHRDSIGHSVTLGETGGEKHIEWVLKLALAECLQTPLPQQRPVLNNAPAARRDGGLVECRECDQRVSTAELESHVAERHFDYRPHFCHTCGFHCYGEAQMVAHRAETHRSHKVTLGQLTGEEHIEEGVRLAMEHTLRGPEAVPTMADSPAVAAAPNQVLPAAPNQARRRQLIRGQVECFECGDRVPHTDRSMCAHVNRHLELTLRQCGLCHRRFTAYPQGVIRRHINTHPRLVADGAADQDIIIFHENFEQVQAAVDEFFGA